MAETVTDPKVEASKPQSLLGGTIQALANKDITALAAGLTELNRQLTGISTCDFGPTKTVLKKIDSFYDKAGRFQRSAETVYLGDSGYSRLILFLQEGEFDIQLFEYTATEEVKQKWAEIQKQYKELDQK